MRIPVSTYRLQFNRNFTFADCRHIVRYLQDLGVTDIYASPIFRAKKGSQHGYDIVEHNEINPELGGEQEFRALAGELRAASMGWVQDIVPNHMAFDSDNRMLMDVLENGHNSPYFNYFDIDWDHPYETLKGRVLVPLLGTFYSDALENGEISLRYDEQGLSIRYYDLKLPLRLRSYSAVFGRKLNEFETAHADSPDFISFLGALRIFEPLSSLTAVNRHYDQIKHAKRILWDFYSRNNLMKEFMDANIAYFNGARGDPASFTPLDELLAEQSFRLSFWKVATEEINYRRFFTINELISLRVEDEPVLDHIHRLVFSLVREGLFTGLRIDHIDGLYDPSAYLRRLKEKTGGVYTVVEKILAQDEELPKGWPVQGTTGYDFMYYLTGIFVNRESEREFARIYAGFTGARGSYEDLAADKKRLIIGKYMAGNIDNLAALMKRVTENDRYGRDITMYGLKRALVELSAFFPVYRTYVDADGIREEDRASIDRAHDLAGAKSPGLMYEMDFIRKFLLLNPSQQLDFRQRQKLLDFVMRFQQFTAPIMAKGFEDTVLYVYNPLISLNEVGGSPERFGVCREEFHDFCRKRAERMPAGLNASATHDTKRGEDTRCRISALSELPEEWGAVLREWSVMNAGAKSLANGTVAPDANDEYFIYQTLLGAYPYDENKRDAFTERMKRYLVKAVREAKVHTAWIKPDLEYENACIHFIEQLLDPSPANHFLGRFREFQEKIAFYGMFNSLAQVLLKCCAPGIPDFYQGTELWDFSLVDPDNRSPVDFNARSAMLEALRLSMAEPGFHRRLLQHPATGEIKLFAVYCCLQARRRAPGLFLGGRYIPVPVEGRFRGNIVAFCRSDGNSWLLAAAPRLLASVVKNGELPLGMVWQDTRLILPPGAPRRWQEQFTSRELIAGQGIPVSEAFSRFPLCLLIQAGQ